MCRIEELAETQIKQSYRRGYPYRRVQEDQKVYSVSFPNQLPCSFGCEKAARRISCQMVGTLRLHSFYLHDIQRNQPLSRLVVEPLDQFGSRGLQAIDGLVIIKQSRDLRNKRMSP